MFGSLRRHGRLLLGQFGMRAGIGDRTYRYDGYFPNRLPLSSLQHEPQMLEIMGRELKRRPGHFVDVGANLGQTMLKVLHLDPARPYVGFEPQIACCFFIEKFLRRNGIGNCAVLPIALSDTNGTIPLYSNTGEDELASTQSDFLGMSPRKSSWIAARNGDEVLAEMGITDPSLIKIDVEGAERQIIRGLRGTIERARPVVMMEILPNFVGRERTYLADDLRRRNSEAADEIHSILSGLDYRIAQIDEHGVEWPIERFDLDDSTDFHGADFIARPDGAAAA